MAFWNNANLDPKRQFKFKVQFNRLGQDAVFLAQTAGRPQYTIGDSTKIDFLDKQFHFPGKITWEPVTIKFVDAVQANVSSDSYSYLKQTGWVSPDAVVPQNFSTISKAKAVTASQGGVLVSVLDSNGAVVDEWNLRNAFITKVALNELDYSAEGILTATYTFRYDWAEFTAR